MPEEQDTTAAMMRAYARNAATLEQMADKARRTGRKVNGYTAAELEAFAASSWAASLAHQAPERCECGAVGVHPFPIGGGWALACDDCRALAEMDAAVGMPGAAPADWAAWAVEARGR